jgi:hypothetical protein
VLGELMGMRPVHRPTKTVFEASARQIKRDVDDAQRVIGELKQRGVLTGEDVSDTVNRHVLSLARAYKVHRDTAAMWEASGLGLTRRDYIKAMVDAGHSPRRAKQVVYGGVLERPVKNKGALEDLYKAGSAGEAEGGSIRLRNYQDAVAKWPRFIPLDQIDPDKYL